MNQRHRLDWLEGRITKPRSARLPAPEEFERWWRDSMPKAIQAYFDTLEVELKADPRCQNDPQAAQEACKGRHPALEPLGRYLEACVEDGEPVSLRHAQLAIFKDAYHHLSWGIVSRRREHDGQGAYEMLPSDSEQASAAMMGVSYELILQCWDDATGITWHDQWKQSDTTDAESLTLLGFGPAELALLRAD